MWQIEPAPKITGPEENIHKRAKDKSPRKCQVQLGRKRQTKRGKEKAQTSANVLDIVDIRELSVTSSESIKFSCYKMSKTVEWFLDSGCTDHITPRKSDFVQYRELGQLPRAEIT